MKRHQALLTLLLILACVGRATGQNANPPIYVVLWFDTEDYILVRDDDATKRLAEMLTGLGVRATFKSLVRRPAYSNSAADAT